MPVLALTPLDGLPAIETVFGGDTPSESLTLPQIAARAAAVYLAGIIAVRIGKSRMVGRVTPLDILLGFILGSLLSRGITGHASLSGTLVGSLTMIFLHWLMTRVACRWHWFGDLIKGQAVVVVRDGLPLRDVMRVHHISPHDLEEEMRLQGVDDVSQVRLAIKERNGEISVLKRDASG